MITAKQAWENKNSERIAERKRLYNKDNRQKNAESHREWRNRNRVHLAIRDSYRQSIKRDYAACGTPIKEIEAAFTGHCHACGSTDHADNRLCVDHDHQTGNFRGWLCRECNLTLGHAQDSLDRLQSLIKYLSCRNADMNAALNIRRRGAVIHPSAATLAASPRL